MKIQQELRVWVIWFSWPVFFASLNYSTISLTWEQCSLKTPKSADYPYVDTYWPSWLSLSSGSLKLHLIPKHLEAYLLLTLGSVPIIRRDLWVKSVSLVYTACWVTAVKSEREKPLHLSCVSEEWHQWHYGGSTTWWTFLQCCNIFGSISSSNTFWNIILF